MMGWQWHQLGGLFIDAIHICDDTHQLDHMQIIYTSLQTDNHASSSPLTFYRHALLAAIPNNNHETVRFEWVYFIKERMKIAELRELLGL